MPGTLRPVSKRFRLLAELPSLQPHVARYRAEQVAAAREVEFRVVAEGARPDAEERFADEARELAALDAPWFLPLLDFGVTRGRPFYLVPRVEAPTLDALVGTPAFSLEVRAEVVRGLAGAMAALHALDAVFEPPPPEWISWDPAHHRARLLHHRGDVDRARPWLPERRPPDLDPGAARSRESDVFRWGLVAYWLLTGGEAPFDGGKDEAVSLATRRPEVAPDLANAVDVSLAWQPGLRPGDGVELFAVLGLCAQNVRAGDDPGTQGRARYQASLSGLTDPQRIDLSSRPAPRRPRARAMLDGARSAEAEANPWPARILAGTFGLGVVALGLGGQAAPEASASAAGAAGGAPGAGRAAGVAAGARSPPLSEAVRAAYRDLPRVRALLARQGLDEGDFDAAWTQLRDVTLARELPPSLADEAGLMRLRALADQDPEAARAQLEATLEGLRVALAPAPQSL